MNLLLSCIGQRGYIADYFRTHLAKNDLIIGTSNTQWTPGFKHCDKSYILPDIIDPDYIPRVMEICKMESISAILSFYDPDVVELSKHFNEFLSMQITPIIPKEDLAMICFDKYATYKFLTSKNIVTAKTYLDYDKSLTDLKFGELNFPLFVKPRFGFGSIDTYKANNEKQLDAFFHYKPNMIIQEELTGEPVNFDILNDLKGNVISVVPWKKLRSRMGETERAQTHKDQSLIDFGILLGNTLRHSGPLDADLFYSQEGITVLEINLRFGGGYPVSHLAGADFPLFIIKMIRGEKLHAKIGDFREDVVMMKDNLVIGGPQSDVFNNIITFRNG